MIFKWREINQNIQKNVLLLLFSLFICTYILEIVLRFFLNVCNYDEIRGQNYLSTRIKSSMIIYENRYILWSDDHDLVSLGEFKYHRIINSDNLSEKEISPDKKINEIRLIALGDSYTEGFGATYDSTWVMQLENSLNKKYNTHRIVAINAGATSSDPVFEFYLLKDKLLKYKPDVVIYSINNTDVLDIALRGGFERYDNAGKYIYPGTVWWEWMFASSYIFRVFMMKFFHYEYYSLIKYNDQIVNKSYETIKQVIVNTHYLSLLNGFKTIVIFHPVPYEVLEKKYRFDFQHIIDYLRINFPQIITIDMLRIFLYDYNINNDNIYHYFWEKDGHHNAKGYELFARGVDWKLKETGMMDSIMNK